MERPGTLMEKLAISFFLCISPWIKDIGRHGLLQKMNEWATGFGKGANGSC